jgi:hypothetical protein
MDAMSVELRALVVGYNPSAAFDDYADGTHGRFGATQLEVLSPQRFERRRFSVYHEDEVAQESPWRATGSVLRFSLDEDLLDEGVQVFAGAARGLGVERGP